MYKKITALFITAALLFSACQTAGTVPGPELVPESSESSSQVSSSSSEPASIAEENKKVPDAETVSAYLMEEESLGGIKLGMTEQEIVTILGNPLSTSNGEFEGKYGYMYSSYFYDGLSVGLVDKGNGRIVNSIRVSGNHPAETFRGIKIGNTKSDIKEIYADIVDPALFPSESMWDLGLRFHGLRFLFEEHPTKGIYVTSIELGELIPSYPDFSCENFQNTDDIFINHRTSTNLLELENFSNIKLGMSEQEVIEKLGQPDVISTTGEMQNQYGYQYAYYFYGGNGTTENDYKMRIAFVDKGKGKFVNHLRIQNDSKAALSTGIQIGSTVEDIEKTYENQINTELTNDNKIVVGFSLRGLHFGLKDGKVSTIDLGYLIPPIDKSYR